MRSYMAALIAAVVSLTMVVACGGGSSGGSSAPVGVASVRLTLPALTLRVARSMQGEAVPLDAYGAEIAGRMITWTSSDASVAIVSSSGVITGVSAGSTTIVASSEGRTGSLGITVTPIVVTGVSVELDAATLLTGQSTGAAALVRDDLGEVLTGRTVEWKSSRDDVATVSSAGVVTARSLGTTVITATSDSMTGSAKVSVTSGQSGSLVLAVAPDLLADVRSALDDFMADLAEDGYMVRLHRVTQTTPTDVRATLIQYWQSASPPLRGVVFVGAVPLPYATYTYHDGSVYRGVSLQYYMDLDGVFSYRGGPVVSEIDDHRGAVEIEIWASILPAYQGKAATVEHVKAYFAKNHAYRSGAMSVQRGFINPVLGSRIATVDLYEYQYRVIRDEYFVPLVGRGNFFVGIDNSLGNLDLYPNSRISYEREMLTDRYDVASIGAHGSTTEFGSFNEYGSIVVGIPYAKSMPIKPVFLFEHSCNTAAIDARENLASEFLYSRVNNVLVFAGATAPQGGMGDTREGRAINHTAALLVAGENVGEAHFAPMRLPYVGFAAPPFREAFAAQQIMLGDGTLRLQEFMRRAPSGSASARP